jgi:hypothetical protein
MPNTQEDPLVEALEMYCSLPRGTAKNIDNAAVKFAAKFTGEGGPQSGGVLRNSRGRFLSSRRNRNSRGRFRRSTRRRTNKNRR